MESKNSESRNKKLRNKYERIMLPVGRAIAKTGLTPNQITLIAFIIGLVPIYFGYVRNFKWLVITFIIAVIFDVLDGNVARATGKTTRFGKVLDHTVDRYVEFSLILALTIGGYLDGRIAVFSLFGMLMPSYIRGKGEAECKVEGAGVGFYERKEKIITILVGLIAFWLGYYQEFIINLAVFITGLMSHITALQRLIFYRKNCAR